MTRIQQKQRWYASMRKRLGVKTNAEVRAWARKNAMKASHPGTGGFAYMSKNDPDRLREISRQAGLKKRRGISN